MTVIVVLRIRKQLVVVTAINVKKATQVKVIPNTAGTHARRGAFECSKVVCMYGVNIMTVTSRAYHTPCEIQSVVIAASFKACVMITVVVVISVIAVVVAVVVISAVVVIVLAEVVVLGVVIAVTPVLVFIVVVAAVVVVVVSKVVSVVVLIGVVVLRALLCAGAVIDVFVEVLTVLTVDM